MFFNSTRILVGAVYLSYCGCLPVFNALTASLEMLVLPLNPSFTLICGDFNLPNVDWSNWRFKMAVYLSFTSLHLINYFSFLNLYQLNNLPNTLGSLLDLIFLVPTHPLLTFLFSPCSFRLLPPCVLYRIFFPNCIPTS